MIDRRLFLAGGVGLLSTSGSRAWTRTIGTGADTLPAVLGLGQTTSVLVLRRGEPVFEHGDPAEVSYVASVRKSLVSMLYGPAVARGAIRLDRTLADLGVDDMEGLLPQERGATVRDLLTARSGVYHPAANAGDASALAPARGSVAAGSRFLYNNWDFNALGAIYERETGRRLYQAFTDDIAEPLGLQDWRADLQQVRNDTGLSRYPAHHFGLSTRDMARLGQVMLDRGRWRNRQVIPAAWVKVSTAVRTPAHEVARSSPFIGGLGYGYLWWVFDQATQADRRLRGAFTATGAYGQFITVVPRRGLVIAHKTAVPPPRNVPAETYFDQILPAVLRAHG
ncbi:MAG TPA: serine hydrolase [Sphingomonadaceae bacterium]|jgi:CubicO group peptidase (beta-lactamase class C family)|nr:serine hydrolase [Sphingomonadaceae bacterium]